MPQSGEGTFLLFFFSMNKIGLIRWNEWANSITGSLYCAIKYGLLILGSWQRMMQIHVNETWRCEFDYFYACLNLLGLFPLWQKQQKTTTLTNETQGFKRGLMKGHLRGQVWPPENQAPLARGGGGGAGRVSHPWVDSYNGEGRRHGRSLLACLGRGKQKLIWETEIYSIGILLPIQSGPIIRTNVLLWLCTCEPELVWNTAPDCSSRIFWSFIS